MQNRNKKNMSRIARKAESVCASRHVPKAVQANNATPRVRRLDVLIMILLHELHAMRHFVPKYVQMDLMLADAIRSHTKEFVSVISRSSCRWSSRCILQ